MVVRGISASQKEDTEDGYNVSSRETATYGKELFKLSSVRAKSSIARVLMTLLKPLWLNGAAVHHLRRSTK